MQNTKERVGQNKALAAYNLSLGEYKSLAESFDLLSAADMGSVLLVQTLLQTGADIALRSEMGLSVLHVAAAGGHDSFSTRALTLRQRIAVVRRRCCWPPGTGTRWLCSSCSTRAITLRQRVAGGTKRRCYEPSRTATRLLCSSCSTRVLTLRQRIAIIVERRYHGPSKWPRGRRTNAASICRPTLLTSSLSTPCG
jgi:hypothetical protein